MRQASPRVFQATARYIDRVRPNGDLAIQRGGPLGRAAPRRRSCGSVRRYLTSQDGHQFDRSAWFGRVAPPMRALGSTEPTHFFQSSRNRLSL